MDVSKYSDYFCKLWSETKPLFKLFRTENNGYLYDTGTNKIFVCNNIEFDILRYFGQFEVKEAIDKLIHLYPLGELVKSLDIIKSNIEEDNILKTGRSILFKGSHFDDLHESLRNAMRMVQLELTERCNLRCTYCIYNPRYEEKRNHGNRDMTIDTAIKAIDNLARNSNNKNEVAITFYGGEPLLHFPLIKSCIQYARSRFKNKTVTFSITTNGTLLTPSMASYFFKEGVSLTISIDGPQDIHDQFRIDSTGHGSFRKTIAALKMLVDRYGDIANKSLSLSMVYTPPYSYKRISRMAELWDQYPWLPRDIPVIIGYGIGLHPIAENDSNEHKIDSSLYEWAEKRFIEDYKKGEKPHPIANSIIEKGLVRIWKRSVHPSPTQEYFLNGCCVPGVRKHYVTVDGTIFLCERIGLAPAIGNVNAGINADFVETNYVIEYAKQSLPQCSNCWVVPMCSICYAQSYKGGKLDMQKKNAECDSLRAMTVNTLSLYCRLLEINRNGLDYLSEMTIC